MKKSELRKLIAEYRNLRLKSKNKSSHSKRIFIELEMLEQRYFHETGGDIDSDLKQQE